MMQNNPEFRAIESAWESQSTATVMAADEASLRQMAGYIPGAKVSDGYLRNAKRLFLQRRRDARQKSRIESIMPAIHKIWPDAGFADCGDYFRIYPGGVPDVPEIAGAL